MERLHTLVHLRTPHWHRMPLHVNLTPLMTPLLTRLWFLSFLCNIFHCCRRHFLQMKVVANCCHLGGAMQTHILSAMFMMETSSYFEEYEQMKH